MTGDRIDCSLRLPLIFARVPRPKRHRNSAVGLRVLISSAKSGGNAQRCDDSYTRATDRSIPTNIRNFGGTFVSSFQPTPVAARPHRIGHEAVTALAVLAGCASAQPYVEAMNVGEPCGFSCPQQQEEEVVEHCRCEPSPTHIHSRSCVAAGSGSRKRSGSGFHCSRWLTEPVRVGERELVGSLRMSHAHDDVDYLLIYTAAARLMWRVCSVLSFVAFMPP